MKVPVGEEKSSTAEATVSVRRSCQLSLYLEYGLLGHLIPESFFHLGSFFLFLLTFNCFSNESRDDPEEAHPPLSKLYL